DEHDLAHASERLTAPYQWCEESAYAGGVKPRSWAPRRALAMLVAALLIEIVPSIVVQLLHHNARDVFVPLAITSLPTTLVVALFALVDRRSPLIAALIGGLAGLLWLVVKWDLGAVAASDAQGALVYVFGPILALPVAILAGIVTWMSDIVISRVRSRSE